MAVHSIYGKKLGVREDGTLQSEGGAFYPPKYATSALPAAAGVEGGIVYDTTTNTLKFSNGSAWVELAAAT